VFSCPRAAIVTVCGDVDPPGGASMRTASPSQSRYSGYCPASTVSPNDPLNVISRVPVEVPPIAVPPVPVATPSPHAHLPYSSPASNDAETN
jgi:hypothetical protein